MWVLRLLGARPAFRRVLRISTAIWGADLSVMSSTARKQKVLCFKDKLKILNPRLSARKRKVAAPYRYQPAPPEQFWVWRRTSSSRKAYFQHKLCPWNRLRHRENSKHKCDTYGAFVNTGVTDPASFECHIVTKLVVDQHAQIMQFFTVK